MRNWFLVFVFFFFVFLYYLYSYVGLKYFTRAIFILESNKTSEIKKISWEIFNNEFEGLYSGIFGGVYFNKVWVWGSFGLKSFQIDQYSVFHYFDGCSSILEFETLSTDSDGLIEKTLFTIDGWLQNIKVGDYVTIKIALIPNGGIFGNLREAYGYNFWPFMQKDLKTECAK
jgi:hypothetical protein